MLKVFIAFIFLFFSGMLAAHNHHFEKVKVESIRLNDHIYMLRGAGGNVGVVVGEQRVILIDSQFAPMSEKIRAAIRNITELPVTHLINTHYHSDHTGGNEKWHPGASIIAHEQTRKILKQPKRKESSNPRMPMLSDSALPFITFNDTLTLHEGNEEIEIKYFPSGHTGGDSVVFFKTSNIIHTGDLFFVGVTPFIDMQHGGSYQGYLAAMEAIIARADDETKIIPGHGVLANKAMMQRAYERLLEFDPTTLD
jgi:glyoxylase-like metal-dependent hydrolase (beta-lactamase superfamily II)